jgi:CYTH domain-containing protein
MGVEIERKFLVVGETWRGLGERKLYRQGYIPTLNAQATLRLRIAGEQGYITIKGKKEGIARAEFEYEIPRVEAEQMLDTLCDRPLIEKYRYRIAFQGLVWEVDEFLGDNAGLIIAEVELVSAQQKLEFPEWIGAEVTEDLRYYNSNLVKYPYCQWTKS